MYIWYQEKEESVNGKIKTVSHRFKKPDKASARYIKRKNRPWNITVKVLETKHKENILKAPKNKRHCLQSNIHLIYRCTANSPKKVWKWKGTGITSLGWWKKTTGHLECYPKQRYLLKMNVKKRCFQEHKNWKNSLPSHWHKKK